MASNNVFLRAPLKDSVFWGLSPNGMFSTKFVYFLNLNDSLGALTRKWRAVWKLKVLERVKVFIWKVLYNKIGTNALRARREITEDALCEACGAAKKSSCTYGLLFDQKSLG